MNGWPNPDKPGYPVDPETDGWHWLFDPENSKSYPEIWVAEMQAWAVGDAWTPRMVTEMGLHYQGLVLTPAEACALKAENARLREALKLIAAGVDTFAINPSGLPNIFVEGGSRFAHERDVLPLIYAARDALYLDGEKERRAKALSELAEMDADLLDMDPEMKP